MQGASETDGGREKGGKQGKGKTKTQVKAIRSLSLFLSFILVSLLLSAWHLVAARRMPTTGRDRLKIAPETLPLHKRNDKRRNETEARKRSARHIASASVVLWLASDTNLHGSVGSSGAGCPQQKRAEQKKMQQGHRGRFACRSQGKCRSY